jgi:DNA replication licensing factor MCM6
MSKEALVNWYLSQIEDEVESVEQLAQKDMEVKGVIERLIHKDGVLLEFKSDGEVKVVVHPNYTF